jgi:hypothetical protein
MTVKLIGKDDTTIDYGCAANYIMMCKFQCTTAGSCSEVRIKVSNTGNVKVAIYLDDAGAPTTQLAVNNTGQSCTAGWNTIALAAATNLTLNSYYWIAAVTDATYIGFDYPTTAVYKFKIGTYTDGLPSPAGTGYTDNTTYEIIAAGWGTVAGWSNIAKISGATTTDMAKVKGIAVADIAKRRGAAV